VTELRTIVRALARAPGFLLLAIAILTTGIALTLYMFGAIDGFVLRPLPYNNADRMIHLELTGPQGDSAVSIGDYFELRDAATTVPDLAAFYDATVNLGGVGEPEPGLQLEAVGGDGRGRGLRHGAAAGRSGWPW